MEIFELTIEPHANIAGWLRTLIQHQTCIHAIINLCPNDNTDAKTSSININMAV
jgi:hypothetical protein